MRFIAISLDEDVTTSQLPIGILDNISFAPETATQPVALKLNSSTINTSAFISAPAGANNLTVDIVGTPGDTFIISFKFKLCRKAKYPQAFSAILVESTIVPSISNSTALIFFLIKMLALPKLKYIFNI